MKGTVERSCICRAARVADMPRCCRTHATSGGGNGETTDGGLSSGLNDKGGASHKRRLSVFGALAFTETFVANQLRQGAQGIRLRVGTNCKSAVKGRSKLRCLALRVKALEDDLRIVSNELWSLR